MSLAQAMVAQYEQQNRTRKMKIGLEAAARSGFWTGGEAPYGYRRVRSADGHHSTLEVDPDESQIIKRIVDLIVNDGLSTIEVCRELSSLAIRTRKGRRWTHRSLLHVIGRRHLLGEIPYQAGSETISRVFPPILNEATFNALQHELDRTRTSPRDTQHTYPLSGRITCDCGETLIGTYRKDRKTRYYVCRRNASSASANGRCPAKASSRRADSLDMAIWNAVSGLLGDPSRLHAAACDFLRDQQERAPHVAKQRAKLQSRLKSIEEDRIRTFRDASRLGLGDGEVQQLLEQLAEERTEIESQLAALGSDPYVGTLELVSERVERLASRARQRLEAADSELQKDILAALSIEVAPTSSGFSVHGTLPELPPSPGKAKTMAPQRC